MKHGLVERCGATAQIFIFTAWDAGALEPRSWFPNAYGMLLTTVASILLAATTAVAQTPSGFTPAVTNHLDVYYGSTYITPGLMMKKSGRLELRQARTWGLTGIAVSKQPTIGVAGGNLTGKYLLAMIDIDV
jgi:phosphatidylethanolamine-binding protein